MVKKLAREFGAVFVPFQSVFDKAQDRAAPEAWAADGVHPTLAGHMLLAKTWCEVVCAARAM
jgi:lysophospholipase L1-like esterase